MKKDEYIGVYWMNKETDEIIFQDAVTVKNFEDISGVSPHTDYYGNHHDVVIKIEMD